MNLGAMPAVTIPPSGLTLESSNSVRSDFTQPHIFNLTLADNVIEDMIKCVRNGKTIQLCSGKDPKIIYGSKSQQLCTSINPTTHELYRTVHSSGASPQTPSSMCLLGKAKRQSLSAKVRTVKSTDGGARTNELPAKEKSATSQLNSSPIAGADPALAALKNSLASEDARKKDNTTKYVKDSLPPAGKKRGVPPPAKPTNKARFLSQKNKSLASATTRSVPTSPALTGIASPSLAPTSVPLSRLQAERAKATRRPVVHRLALGPASEPDLLNDKPSDLTEQEFKQALEKVADLVGGKWTLKSKAFKELDVFNYREYTASDRQIAIENAVRVYDKLRLNSAEPEWDRLNPPEDRGTGKCLSKLQAKIAGGGIQPVKAPKINVHCPEESGRDTPNNTDGDSISYDKPSTKGGESMARSHSNPGATKARKASEKEVQTKRLLAKPGSKVAKSAAAKPSEKKPQGRESAKIKSAEYVGDSDEDEETATAATLAAATVTKPIQASVTKPTLKPAPKRGRDGVPDQNVAPINKKPRPLNSVSPQKRFLVASSPPANASDMYESSSSNNGSLKRMAGSSLSADEPVSKRHQASSISSDDAISKRHHKSNSASSSSSANVLQGAHQNGNENGIGVNTGRTNVKEKYAHIPQAQRALNAHKFNAFYKSYKQLHLELSTTKIKDRLKMAELLDMQDRLTKLKKEVLEGLDSHEGD